jgi:hypothetical protein
MSEKIIYNRALLDEVFTRDGATLIGEIQNLCSRTILEFKCACNTLLKRKFGSIARSYAKCRKCSLEANISQQKTTHFKTCYNKEYLITILEKDNAKICPDNDYNTITAHSFIDFICNCGKKNNKKFQSLNSSGGAYCKECSIKNNHKKGKNTNKKKYGVEFTQQNMDIRKKGKETNIQKYGVPFTFQSDSVKTKMKNTNKIKYGVEYPSQNSEIRDKIKQTCQIRYGTDHPNQNKKIQEKIQKTAKKYKEYKMPSGQIRKVQGYEPFALDALLKIYAEDQIKSERKDVPRIPYLVDENQRYYFPDIFIPKDNKIIEVKSTWTYKCKTDNIDLKKKATEENGYVYELWCFNAKGVRVLV